AGAPPGGGAPAADSLPRQPRPRPAAIPPGRDDPVRRAAQPVLVRVRWLPIEADQREGPPAGHPGDTTLQVTARSRILRRMIGLYVKVLGRTRRRCRGRPRLDDVYVRGDDQPRR